MKELSKKEVKKIPKENIAKMKQSKLLNLLNEVDRIDNYSLTKDEFKEIVRVTQSLPFDLLSAAFKLGYQQGLEDHKAKSKGDFENE